MDMPKRIADTILLKCGCGTSLKAPVNASGRRVKCPKCGAVLSVPAPAADAAVVNDSPAREPAGSAIVPCAACGAAMPADAVLCVACGYNTRTGKMVKSASTGRRTAMASDTARRVGSLVLGCVLGVICAAVCGAVWYFAAIKFGNALGVAAWAVGFATGVGMAIGARADGIGLGVAASAIALLSVFAAKIGIYGTLFVTVSAPGAPNRDVQRGLVEHYIAREILISEHRDPAKADEAQWFRVNNRAAARVEKMSEAELQREYDRVKTQYAVDSDADAEPDPGVTSRPAQSDASVSRFLASTFTLFDTLFVVMAAATAFHFGSGRFHNFTLQRDD